MAEIIKIVDGKIVDPQKFVYETLREMVDAAGGIGEFTKMINEYGSMPERALNIAFRHSRLEGIVAGVGEVLIAASVYTGIMGCVWHLMGRLSPYPWAEILVLVFCALTLRLGLQALYAAVWCRRYLIPAFVGRSKCDALRASHAFYGVFMWRLALPGRLVYPMMTVFALLWIDASLLAWCILLPRSLLGGWMISSAYCTRLLQTDVREWFAAFGLALSEEDEGPIREARKGLGLHRRLWTWLEARHCDNVSPFEMFAVAQCFLGLRAGIVVLASLAIMEERAAEIGIAVTMSLGLIAVAYSFFRRFAFLSWLRRGPRIMSLSPTNHVRDLENGEDRLFSLARTSRILRKAMP